MQRLLSLCKEKDWDGLKEFLPSDIKDSSVKILVSAMFDTYHNDEVIRQEYDLKIWDSSLHDDFYTPIESMYFSYVNLLDFYKAYRLAKNPVDSKDTHPGLGDELVAQRISSYVFTHRKQLVNILNSMIPLIQNEGAEWNNLKALIKRDFGDLTIGLVLPVSVKENPINTIEIKYAEVKSQTTFGNNEKKSDAQTPADIARELRKGL